MNTNTNLCIATETLLNVHVLTYEWTLVCVLYCTGLLLLRTTHLS